MRRYLLPIVFMLASLSCKEDNVSAEALDCYSWFKGLRRG
jgi:hypothetical protein